jgi:molybdate transport system ATP-binding protein
LPYIERLPATFGVPVLYVTHSLDEVARLASSVVLVGNGRIVATGGVAEIFERPDLVPFTGGTEAGAVLRVRVAAHANGIATLALGTERLRAPMPALPIGTDMPLRIHARDVALATRRPSHLSIRNVLAGRILRIERETTLNVDIVVDVAGQHLRSRITLDALDELGLVPGQEVFALVKSIALESSLLG